MTDPRTIKIKPAGKLHVRFPDNGHRHLAEEGELVVSDQYWQRRISDGDVKVMEEPAPQTQAKDTK